MARRLFVSPEGTSAVRTSLLVLFLLVAMGAGVLHAGDTGKLNGTIRDKDSKEALVGANVLLTGTSLGGASNVSGFYFVTGIPPGTYRVQVSLIGYQTTVYSDVRIMADADHRPECGTSRQCRRNGHR